MSDSGRFRFQRHYTRDEARALLPRVRGWIIRLRELQLLLRHHGERVAHLLKDGHDAGGSEINYWVKALTHTTAIARQFETREIQLRDLERGLVDFPAFYGGREVFLCWEEDEEDIEFWHDLDAGFSGRNPLG